MLVKKLYFINPKFKLSIYIYSSFNKNLVTMMQQYYDSNFASLHVRVSNRAALNMYKNALGFE